MSGWVSSLEFSKELLEDFSEKTSRISDDFLEYVPEELLDAFLTKLTNDYLEKTPKIGWGIPREVSTGAPGGILGETPRGVPERTFKGVQELQEDLLKELLNDFSGELPRETPEIPEELLEGFPAKLFE